MDKNNTRLNPMTEVMDFELLEVANLLMTRGQDERYWNEVRVPRKPDGQVSFEVVRQVATFAIPFLGLVLGWHYHGLTGLLLALPLALLVGFLLDWQLQRAISKQYRRDAELDRGRYDATLWLAEQMGMSPADITLDVIRKMYKDYGIVKGYIDKELTRRDDARKAREEADAVARRNRRNKRYSQDEDTFAGSATAAAMVLDATADVADDADELGLFPTINPGSGMPMMPNSAIDVGGNVFGTDNVTHNVFPDGN